MQFPVQLTFKVIALNPQVRVTDATGQLVLYVKQRAFKLKEHVTVFRDAEQSVPLYEIRADRVLDYNANYAITDTTGRTLGALRRDGPRSLFKARYEITGPSGEPRFRLHEENAWIKVLDGLTSEIPLVGPFVGYFFNPAYTVERDAGAQFDGDGEDVMRLKKQPAFWEGKFELSPLAELGAEDKELVLLSTLMMILRERMRG